MELSRRERFDGEPVGGMVVTVIVGWMLGFVSSSRASPDDNDKYKTLCWMIQRTAALRGVSHG